MTEQLRIVVCGRGPMTPGSVPRACAGCGCEVWVSPASMDAPGRRVCRDCALARGAGSEGLAPTVSYGTLLECAEVWECTLEQAFERAARKVRDEFGVELQRPEGL
jgi:hypothetical protein